jgi:hypothetical protein
MAGSTVQVVEYLPSMCKVLVQSLVLKKIKERKGRKEGRKEKERKKRRPDHSTCILSGFYLLPPSS